MSYKSPHTSNRHTVPYKPFELTNPSSHYCPNNGVRLHQFEKNLGDLRTLARPYAPRIHSPVEAKFETADRASQVQKLFDMGHSYIKLISDSTEVSTKITVLTENSSRLVTVTRTVKVQEVSQLVVFIDETTLLVVNQLRIIKQTTSFSNIEEVTRSLHELSGLLDSRLKRFGAALAECLEALGRATATLTGSSKIRAIQTQLAALISKVPRLQALLVRGVSVLGKALAAIGIAISAYQTYDKWKTYEKTKTPENLKKAIIETIAFVVGIILIIVGAIFGGTVAIVIAAALLIYGVIDAYYAFKSPDHQDFIAQGTYAGGEYLYSLLGTLSEGISRIGEAIDGAIQRIGHYLHDQQLKLTHMITELTDKIEHEATELLDDVLLGLKATFSLPSGLSL